MFERVIRKLIEIRYLANYYVWKALKRMVAFQEQRYPEFGLTDTPNEYLMYNRRHER